MWGATQPCSGAGSQPIRCAAAPATSAPLRCPGRSEKPADPAAELAEGEVADAGALQRASGIDVGESRTAADAVEAADGAVAVVADWQRPAVAADQVAQRVAIVADVQREETHPSTVAPIRPLHHILLGDAAVALGEPERDHQRLAEEVADADRAGGVDLAGGRTLRVLGARDFGGFAVVLGDVGVAFEFARPCGYRELRQRPAGRQLVEAQRPSPAPTLDRVDGGEDDHRREKQPDDDRVAVPHSRSSQSRTAGRTRRTPARAALRSTTVTAPKSRSICTSPAISTAKPAIAVTPEASTAAPVRA